MQILFYKQIIRERCTKTEKDLLEIVNNKMIISILALQYNVFTVQKRGQKGFLVLSFDTSRSHQTDAANLKARQFLGSLVKNDYLR